MGKRISIRYCRYLRYRHQGKTTPMPKNVYTMLLYDYRLIYQTTVVSISIENKGMFSKNERRINSFSCVCMQYDINTTLCLRHISIYP